MYTVTFYSFKGGVGRTMAMVNTALALAQAGKRVLLVDFDLEAPGLTTFDRLRSDGPHPGIVEYVSDYLRTGTTPELEDYIFEAPTSEGPGKTWVLPAGREDSAYRKSLAQINWLDLYNERNGFLLFEDMKYQIEKKYEPDYVLIDSRTGHSDIEGICTRHLPDAVVILFFPNEQNLCGLDTVCRNIRAERDTGLRKDIALHFAMSNVPDLDDEDLILQKRIREFRRRLDFKKLSTTIHHYNSLTLLNQSVFVLDRPASRLAKQYRRLLDEIVKSNISDKTGVLDYLRDVRASDYRPPSANRGVSWLQDTEKRVQNIAAKFPDDTHIQFAAATAFVSLGQVEEAINRLDKILEDKPGFVVARLERASCRAMLGKTSLAVADLMESIKSTQLNERQVIAAVRLLSTLDIAKFSEAAVSSAVSSLSAKAKFLVADNALRNARAWDIPNVTNTSIGILESVFAGKDSDPDASSLAKNDLALLLIHEGRWDQAMQVVAPSGEPGSSIEDIFNFAMAEWGRDGELTVAFMERVFKKILSEESNLDANFYQCAAVTAWAAGRQGEATNYLETAIRMASDVGRTVFSCWRYAFVLPDQFLRDCEALRSMIQGAQVFPQFIERIRSKAN
jgi:cellulose biosynthesis protein BcsQ